MHAFNKQTYRRTDSFYVTYLRTDSLLVQRGKNLQTRAVDNAVWSIVGIFTACATFTM